MRRSEGWLVAEPYDMATAWADEFIGAYESARITGDTASLVPFLDPGLRFDDPQLPGGYCDTMEFLELLRRFAGSFAELRMERLGPCCVSPDGGTFVQRWVIEGRLASDDPGGVWRTVHLETLESFERRGKALVRMTVFARDLISQ